MVTCLSVTCIRHHVVLHECESWRVGMFRKGVEYHCAHCSLRYAPGRPGPPLSLLSVCCNIREEDSDWRRPTYSGTHAKHVPLTPPTQSRGADAAQSSRHCKQKEACESQSQASAVQPASYSSEGALERNSTHITPRISTQIPAAYTHAQPIAYRSARCRS